MYIWSVWLRGLIKPPPGHGVAYIDWEQQEFGIAAALSGDANMAPYRSGDPYLAFAKQADAAQSDATKATHKAVREQFKQCVLAVQFGMGEESLAHRIGQPPIQARHLLRLHRETYRTYWNWSDAACDFAMMRGYLPTVFGWCIRVGTDVNPRMLRNFPMQANGAEMLRLACCLGTERGIEICAPVHDAVLICAPLDRLEADVARTQEAIRRLQPLRSPVLGFGTIHGGARSHGHDPKESDGFLTLASALVALSCVPRTCLHLFSVIHEPTSRAARQISLICFSTTANAERLRYASLFGRFHG